MNDRCKVHLSRALAAASLAASLSSVAFAADVSPWDEDLQSAARLIAAQALNTPAGRVFRAGIEIKLKEGWKTYWRYPGDSGVPPRWDFAGSQNVKTVDVRFPAPERFPDGAGGNSIGYKGDTVLPLRIVPQDAAKPVSLRLKLDYAVCEKLCVPAEARLALELTGAGGANEAAVVAAEAKVPMQVNVGEPSTPAIKAVHSDVKAGKRRILVDVAGPPDARVSLFAEGPNQQWALPLPEPATGAPDGGQRFAFDLDGVPPGEKPEGATLRLTAVSRGKAVEALFRLD